MRDDGLEVNPGDIVYACETDTKFLVIGYDDNEEEFMMSEYDKKTGFPGCPTYAGDEDGCFDMLHQVMCDKIAENARCLSLESMEEIFEKSFMLE